MKYLQDYQEARQTELFNRLGTFFAFSTKQFNEAKKEGTKYINMGAGMLTPAGTEKELIDTLELIHNEAMAQDIKENGITGIIRRELYNHEAFYTGGINSTCEALEPYKEITKEMIRVEYNKIRSEEINH